MRTKGIVLLLAAAAILLSPSMTREATYDYLMIGPADFTPGNEVLKYTCTENYLSPKNTSLGPNTFIAPVHLPAGAKVSGLWLVYEDNSDIERIHVYWYRKNMTSGVREEMARYETQDSVAGIRRVNITPNTKGKGQINNGNCTYSIKVAFSDGLTTLKIYGIRFFYTM